MNAVSVLRQSIVVSNWVFIAVKMNSLLIGCFFGRRYVENGAFADLYNLQSVQVLRF